MLYECVGCREVSTELPECGCGVGVKPRLSEWRRKRREALNELVTLTEELGLYPWSTPCS